MSDDKSQRKRAAFIGRSTARTSAPPYQSPPAPPPPAYQQRPYAAPAPPQEPSPARRVVRQQMAPARRRLTANEGFAPAVNTPVMDDAEVEAFVSAAEVFEPGSMIRPGHDTGSVQIGGPGFKEPKPGPE